MLKSFSLGILSMILIASSFAITSQAAEVTDADEKWQNMSRHSRMAYEWFYFDLHNPDGNGLAIAFLGPNPFDVDLGTLFSIQGIKKNVGVLAQAMTPDGKRLEVLNYTRDNDIEFQESPFHLRINQSTLEMEKMQNGLPQYKITLNAKDRKSGQIVKGELIFTSLMKGWKHQEGYVYSDGAVVPKDYHKWFATVPKAVVSGWYEFTAKDGKTSHRVNIANGSGYHDHNYGTLPIADTTDGWYWGRAQVNDKTIIYAKVFGKSKAAFLGDFTFRKNPESTMFFMATEDEVLVDSHDMILNDFGKQNKTTLANGMVVPKSYQISVRGLNSELYQLDIQPTIPLAVSVPYYSRQGGKITLVTYSKYLARNDYVPEVSETMIVEQIDYPRFLQLELGLPKPL